MHPASETKRSPLCRLITGFHSKAQRRIARYDLLGAAVSTLLMLALVMCARLLFSR
jgi:hypothetical protein